MVNKSPSIRHYAATEQLERKDNQDYYFTDEKSQLYLVADGMGGLEGGAYASKFASELTLKLIRSIDSLFSSDGEPMKDISIQPDDLEDSPNDDYEEILQTMIKEIHDGLIDETDRMAFEKMGCTLVLVLLRNKKAYVLNVGDSPCYLYSEQTLRQVTRSHSKVDQMVRDGEITKEEAKVHPKRNVITRCLGGQKDKAKADIHVMPYYKNDRFFLCTDGVTKVLSDEEIESFLKIKDSKKAIDQMMAAIKKAPPERSSTSGRIILKDNATAMIVDVVSLEEKKTKKTKSLSSTKGNIGEQTFID
ncbi:MAG: protein phosphatase 2C domain-containing protein [Pseudomonadota bacterium]